MLVCELCNKEYTLDNPSNRKGASTYRCSSCSVNARRRDKKLKLLELFGNKCSICSFDADVTALCFHHVHPEDKRFEISGSHTRSFYALVVEANKCAVLCAPCHNAIHRGTLISGFENRVTVNITREEAKKLDPTHYHGELRSRQ